MGPGDPFSDSTATRQMPDNDILKQLPEKPAMKPMQAVNSKSKYILGGLILGILFGIGILVIGWSSTILIGICGGAGALIAWVVYGLADGQLDFNAAWRALRRK